MRRYLIIGAIVVVLAGLGVAAYFAFIASSPGLAVAPGNTTLPGAGNSTTTPIVATSTEPAKPATVTARLVKISAGPVVAGEVVLDVPAVDAASTSSPQASSTADVAVRYLERQSGNVFSYSVKSGQITRISNKTVPGIQSAAWLPDGSRAFVRYLSGIDSTTINTYALSPDGSGGFFLPQNLTDINVSATGILTLASGVNGSSGSILHPDGTHPAEVFSTPLSMLRAAFAGKSQYLVYTRPSATLDGDAFIVNAKGLFTRVTGPLLGLVALASPSGKWVFATYTDKANALNSELVNSVTGETIQLPVGTIADKCVWTADDSAVYCGIPVNPSVSFAYPDDWYQGAVSFSDRVWKIDVTGRFAQLVLDFSKDAGTTLDLTNPAIDAANGELVFTNKNDGSLWGFSL